LVGRLLRRSHELLSCIGGSITDFASTRYSVGRSCTFTTALLYLGALATRLGCDFWRGPLEWPYAPAHDSQSEGLDGGFTGRKVWQEAGSGPPCR